MAKFTFKKKAKEEAVEEVKETKKRGRPAKAEREEKKTSKATKTSSKKEEAAPKRGRQAGVRWQVNEDNVSAISEKFSEYEKNFKGLDQNLTSFLEKGIKSAAKLARECIQNNTKLAKEFRALIQEAKENMEQVEIE